MTKITAWNGVHINAPQDWEAIIKEKKHLLFEKDLVPIVEIRWEEREQVDDFYKSLSQKLGFPAAIKRLPQGFESLKKKYHIYGYHNAGELIGLFCHCTKCSSLLHIHIHNTFYLQDICSLLHELNCHPEENKNLWQIQDIHFSLPAQVGTKNWELEKYTFGAGATQLCFIASKKILRLYRIAEAEKNLQNTPLPEILQGFSHKHHGPIHDKTWGLALMTTPSLRQQVLYRLRKDRPFYLARIRHIPSTNRILGLSLEDVHPIAQDKADEIWNTYGTFL